MSEYPQQFLDLADYLQIATELQNGDALDKAASYWSRWYWVKKAGEKYTATNSNDNTAYQYLSTQIGLVQQMKSAVPSIADKKGKEMMQQFIARDRKQIIELEQSGDYSNAASRWKQHVMYLNIVVYSQPEVPQFEGLRKKAKARELEIMKAMQSGSSVPSMTLTASMACSQAFIPRPAEQFSQPAGQFSPITNQYHPQPPTQVMNEPSKQEMGGLPFVAQNYDTASPSIPLVSQFQPRMSPFPPSNHNDDGLPSIPGNNPPLPNLFASQRDSGMPPRPSTFNGPTIPSIPTISSSDSTLPPFPAPPMGDNGLPPFPSPMSGDNRRLISSPPPMGDNGLPPFPSPVSSDNGLPPFPSPKGGDNRMIFSSLPPKGESGLPPFPSPKGGDNRMMFSSPPPKEDNGLPPFSSPVNSDNGLPPFPSPAPGNNGLPPFSSPISSDNRMPQYHTTKNNKGPNPSFSIVGSDVVSSSGSSYKGVISGWENNTEGLLNTYNAYAEFIKDKAPKVAKALYASMAEACRKDPRFQGYCGQFEQAMNSIKC